MHVVLRTWGGLRCHEGALYARTFVQGAVVTALLLAGLCDAVRRQPPSLWGVSTMRAAVPFATLSNAQPRKLALIVAIAEYQNATKLHSLNDVPLVKNALRRHGFAEQDIAVITERRATREGIIQAIQHLLERAHTGSIIHWHYSGHGTRLPDDGNDELDGMDEALVPYDATLREELQLFIRDDEIGVWLDRLRSKVGPTGSVLFTIDACYAGTITRDDRPLPARDYFINVIEIQHNREEAARTIERMAIETPSAPIDNRRQAPYAVITAASHLQKNNEIESYELQQIVGPLSLALHNALYNVQLDETYGTLFDRIRHEMMETVPYQTPQLEGIANGRLFSGAVRERAKYFRVEKMKDDSTAVISGGYALGIRAGAEVSLMNTGKRGVEEDWVYAKGRVLHARQFYADVRFPYKINDSIAIASRAVVTAHSFGAMRLSVRLDVQAPDMRALLKRHLEKLTFINFDGNGDAVELQARSDSVIISADAGNMIVGSFATNDIAYLYAIEQKLIDVARNRYLTGVRMQDARIDIKAQALPAMSTNSYTCQIDPVATRVQALSDQAMRFITGQWYKLQVRNTGRDSAYIAVLSIMPNGRLRQLYPIAVEGAAGEIISGEQLPPGDSTILGYVHEGRRHEVCYSVDMSRGMEILKVFATRKPVDFQSIITTRGNTGIQHKNGKALSSLELLLADLYTGQTKDPRPLPSNAGTTKNIQIDVVKN